MQNQVAKDTAERVATKLQNVGFFGSLSTIITFVYGLYQAWSMCHGTSTSAYQEVKAGYNPGSESFSTTLMRRAKHRATRKNRKENLGYTEEQIDTITHHALVGVMEADESSVQAACSGFCEESDLSMHTQDEVNEIVQQVVAGFNFNIETLPGAAPQFSPAEMASILQQLIDQAPKLIKALQVIGPFANLLPKPFNLLADPNVISAINMIPQLLPLLQRIKDALSNL